MAETLEPTMPATTGTDRAVPAPRRFADPFAEMRERMDRLFDGMLGPFEPFGRPRAAAPPMVMPHVDIAESDAAVTITAELPGLEEKDVSLTVLDGVLTLTGEKRAETEETGDKKSYHLVERSYGAFTRSFRLPETVDPDTVTAVFDKGVLTVTLPKTAQARERVRTIPIGGGTAGGGGSAGGGAAPDPATTH